MLATLGTSYDADLTQKSIPSIAFCEENVRLLDEFLSAIRNITELQSQQTRAVIDGDSDFARFDILLQLAQGRKDRAKYAWIAHVDAHGCCG